MQFEIIPTFYPPPTHLFVNGEGNLNLCCGFSGVGAEFAID